MDNYGNMGRKDGKYRVKNLSHFIFFYRLLLNKDEKLV